MDSSRNLDDVQNSLENTLKAIEDEVGRILEQPFDPIHPDGVLDSLDERADELCRVLSSMDTSLEQIESSEPADLNGIASRALTKCLDAVDFPVVTNYAWDDSLPPLSLPAPSVCSAVEQVMRLTFEFAGLGGEVAIRTHRYDDQAILEVEAIQLEESGAVAGSYELRFQSAVEFVQGLGGGFELDTDTQCSLRVEVSLPVGIEVT